MSKGWDSTILPSGYSLPALEPEPELEAELGTALGAAVGALDAAAGLAALSPPESAAGFAAPPEAAFGA